MQRKILIVDDVKTNRVILKAILGDEYDVLEAADGREALALMQGAHTELSAVLLDLSMPVMDGFEVLQCMRADARLMQLPVIVATGQTEEASEVKALTLGANDYIAKPYNATIIRQRLKNTINLRETAAAVNALKRDVLTGLYNREAFMERVAELVHIQPTGYYVLSCLDINSFKVLNDQYGTDCGDEALRRLADRIRQIVEPVGGIACRVAADGFAALYPAACMRLPAIETLNYAAVDLHDGARPVTLSVGRYIIDDPELPPNAMYDRAAMAKASVKGRYDVHVALYDESMRAQLLREQEIVNDMRGALEDGQFEVWYQPQFNHSSGALIGAEALVRWRHPAKGMIPPGDFIPVFERNGFIYELDKYVWEQVCALLRRWREEKGFALPVSVNLSRADLFYGDLVEGIAALTRRYGVTGELIRFEITETAFAESTDRVVDVVAALQAQGFAVEIDDFGSGYSSLNVLKDVPADILKLDMRFLESGRDSSRGGNILESVVRMAKWLGMPVIAEGVETAEQAEFLKSIGCDYVQGYLYAHPMPAAEYEAFAGGYGRGESIRKLETVEGLDNNAFWDPKSMDTLIFNSYVGGACIFEYHNGRTELLRANDNYARELGIDAPSLMDARSLEHDPAVNDETRRSIMANIRRAVETGEESSCEVRIGGPESGGAYGYVRLTVRVIARAGERCLLYGSVFNMTALRTSERKEREANAQMRALMDDTPGGFCRLRLNADGTAALAYANAGFYKLVDMTQEEAAALHKEDAFNGLHPDDAKTVRESLEGLMAEGGQFHTIYRLRHGGGGYVWVMAFGRLVKTESGEAYLNQYFTDVSEQRRAENARKELLDNLPCGAALYRLEDGRLTALHLNKRYRELVGRPIADPEAASVLGAVHPDDRAGMLEEVRAAIREDRDILCDARLRYGETGKEYRPFRVAGRAVPSDGGAHAIYTTFSQLDEGATALEEMLPHILSAIMDASSDLAFAKDRTLRYTCCSGSFARMAGRESEREIIGKTDYDLFGREVADKFRADDIRLMDSGRSIIDMVEPIPSDDGIPHYSRTSKYLLRDKTGCILGLYGVGRDVTEYRAAFERLQLLTNSISGGLASYEVSRQGMRLIYCSDGYYHGTGYEREAYQSLAEADPTCLVFAEDLPRIRNAAAGVLGGEDEFRYEYRCRCRNGGYRWLSVQGVVTERYTERNAALVNVVKFDITNRKAAEEKLRMSEEQYRLAQRLSGAVMCRYEVADRSLHMSAELAAMLDRPERMADVPNAPVREGSVDPDSREAYIGFYESIQRGEESVAAEFELRTPDGWRWLSGRAYTIFSDAGEPAYAIIVFVDTTEQHRQAAEREALRQQAETDGMTGVYNKTATETRIREMLRESRGEPCTLLIADVDNLKTINDTLGHPQGDRAIALLADALKTQFRQTDVIGRIGGDEFIVYLCGVNDPYKVQKLMTALTERLDELRVGENNETPLCASIGVATGETGVDDFDGMYQRADKALYFAKRNGKKQFAFYAPEMEG